MKYICSALAVGAGISLAAYLAVAKCINALGEAVEGMGDLEVDWDEYDRLEEDKVEALEPRLPVLERTDAANQDFIYIVNQFRREMP